MPLARPSIAVGHRRAVTVAVGLPPAADPVSVVCRGVDTDSGFVIHQFYYTQ